MYNVVWYDMIYKLYVVYIVIQTAYEDYLYLS